MSPEKLPHDQTLLRGVFRFNAKVFGLVLGVVLGLLIFVGTNWLVIKGGHIDSEGRYVVGPHLKLLGQFFIGYQVSFLGSLVGFLYGFASGDSVWDSHRLDLQ